MNSVNRIIDANINRTKEGLRVCEEIARFLLNNHSLTSRLKYLRHEIDSAVSGLVSKAELLKGRSSLNDVGRDIYANELRRESYRDIFFANMQRVKESIRVLEEFSKLRRENYALKFKKVRYKIYDIEKKAFEKISGLRAH